MPGERLGVKLKWQQKTRLKAKRVKIMAVPSFHHCLESK
jgi:hypothetical protein